MFSYNKGEVPLLSKGYWGRERPWLPVPEPLGNGPSSSRGRSQPPGRWAHTAGTQTAALLEMLHRHPHSVEIWRDQPDKQNRTVRRIVYTRLGARKRSKNSHQKLELSVFKSANLLQGVYLEVAHHDQTHSVGAAGHQSAGVDPTSVAVFDHLGVAQKAHHHHCRTQGKTCTFTRHPSHNIEINTAQYNCKSLLMWICGSVV